MAPPVSLIEHGPVRFPDGRLYATVSNWLAAASLGSTHHRLPTARNHGNPTGDRTGAEGYVPNTGHER